MRIYSLYVFYCLTPSLLVLQPSHSRLGQLSNFTINNCKDLHFSFKHTPKNQSKKGSMDWFSWLSKTELEPSLVYEYGLAFAHNELEQDDIIYFNHEFLQSMGISVGKHRLEILKLAKKERGAIPKSMSRFVQLIKRTKRSFSKYIRKWSHREELALALVPKRNSSSRWKNAMLKRNKRVAAAKQNTLLLTNGSPIYMSDSRMNSFANPVTYDLTTDEKMGVDYDEYWTTSDVEEIKWDTMFQNLKPT